MDVYGRPNNVKMAEKTVVELLRDMESQEGHKPDLEWLGKWAKPAGRLNPLSRGLGAFSRLSRGQLASFAYLIAAAIRYAKRALEEQQDVGYERATNLPALDKGAQTGVSVQLVTVLTGDHQPNASLVVVATAAVGIGPWLETGKRLVAVLAMPL